MRISRLAVGLIVTCFLWPSAAAALDTTNTRFLNQPAIGGGHIAFVYANDLWVANTDGTSPRRLTSDEGVEANPVFSPDGDWIAFDAEYDGNTDVYIVPVEGGIPTRLTWHPYADNVCSFTPDGSEVLFRSARDVFTRRYTQLFTVPVVGGFPERLELPNAVKASYSPDGTRLAYTPLGERVPPVEELPRRHGDHHLALYIFGSRRQQNSAAPGPQQRHRPDVDRQPGLLHLRPQRRVQPLLLRPGLRRRRTAHPVQGLSHRRARRTATA